MTTAGQFEPAELSLKWSGVVRSASARQLRFRGGLHKTFSPTLFRAKPDLVQVSGDVLQKSLGSAAAADGGERFHLTV